MILSPARRVRKAYWIAFSVAMSYWLLRLREMGWVEESRWGMWAAVALAVGAVWPGRRPR